MRISSMSACVSLALCSTAISAQVRPASATSTIQLQQLSPVLVARQAKLAPVVKPGVQGWVDSEARSIAARKLDADAAHAVIVHDAGTRFAGQTLSNGDVEALAFLVMMQAAKSADDDLKSMMQQMKEANDRRARLRTDKSKADSLKKLDELSEMEQIRLQTMMDRRSKYETMLSNILKKMSDTSGAIISNLK
jgi:hypothetical protein